MAKKYHPDLNPNASAKAMFEKIQNAYETLQDETKKEDYDKKMGLNQVNSMQRENFSYGDFDTAQGMRPKDNRAKPF